MNILDELKKDNPNVAIVTLQIYADALSAYIEANRNIVKNGTIVAHPRTGAPIDNPYLKVRDSASRNLQSKALRRVLGDRVLALLEAGQ